jgi:hypothetical protein
MEMSRRFAVERMAGVENYNFLSMALVLEVDESRIQCVKE